MKTLLNKQFFLSVVDGGLMAVKLWDGPDDPRSGESSGDPLISKQNRF